jgi:hypothetical protein
LIFEAPLLLLYQIDRVEINSTFFFAGAELDKVESVSEIIHGAEL